MLFGVALFIGGMIAIILINKLTQSSYSQSSYSQNYKIAQAKPISDMPTVSLKPAMETTPTGELRDLNVNVSEQIREVFRPAEGLPCTSFDMDNNGPDPVYFCVNRWINPQAPLNPGQSIHVDLKRQGAIKKIYLKCARGQNSNVSFFILK